MTAMASAPVLAGERELPRAPAVRHTVLLWSAFAVVHVALVVLCLRAPGWPLGDVERVYLDWAVAATSGGPIVGITAGFVYPILALVPFVVALALGPDWYPVLWLGIVTLLNVWAFAVLVRTEGSGQPPRGRIMAAWWWIGFLALLGPIALSRIDSVTVPLVIVALLWLQARPLWGAVLLTVATWVKVWPAAAVAALLVASRDRLRLGVAAVVTSAVIALGVVLLGGGAHLFSFVSQQTTRGIQIESPVAVPWLWQVATRVPGASIYYDRQILTYQVTGAGVAEAIRWMTPLLAVVVAAVLLLGWRAQRRGAGFQHVFPTLMLALIAALVVFNKVGSPQFITWFAAPVILALVLGDRSWRAPAVLVAVLAVLTHVVYPYLYHFLLGAVPAMLLVLTIRNVLELVVLGWAVQRLWALPRRSDVLAPKE